MSDNYTPESETPQTDYHLKMYAKGYYSSPVSIDLAQELERENTQLKRENDALRAINKQLLGVAETWLKEVDLCNRGDPELGNDEYNITIRMVSDLRAAIDAARKEAKP